LQAPYPVNNVLIDDKRFASKLDINPYSKPVNVKFNTRNRLSQIGDSMVAWFSSVNFPLEKGSKVILQVCTSLTNIVSTEQEVTLEEKTGASGNKYYETTFKVPCDVEKEACIKLVVVANGLCNYMNYAQIIQMDDINMTTELSSDLEVIIDIDLDCYPKFSVENGELVLDVDKENFLTTFSIDSYGNLSRTIKE
jgi:hypothetical protein